MAAKKTSLNGLFLLVVIVNRPKADFFIDFLQSNASAFQATFLAEGTGHASKTLGIDAMTKEKAAIFAVIQEDHKKELLEALEDKFASVRHCDGVAFTVPFSSVIGASVFSFLSNREKPSKEGEK